MTGDGTANPHTLAPGGGGGGPVCVRWGDELRDKGDGMDSLMDEDKDEGDVRFSLSRVQSRSMISLPPEPFMIMRSKVCEGTFVNEISISVLAII